MSDPKLFTADEIVMLMEQAVDLAQRSAFPGDGVGELTRLAWATLIAHVDPHTDKSMEHLMPSVAFDDAVRGAA